MAGLTSQAEASISHMGQFFLCDLYACRNAWQNQIEDRGFDDPVDVLAEGSFIIVKKQLRGPPPGHAYNHDVIAA